MTNYLDEYSMRQASIFELRNIAREIGVPSPTIYKKEVLIEKINKIMSGEEKPQVPKSRQGRPPKSAVYANNIKYCNNSSRDCSVDLRGLFEGYRDGREDNKYDFSTIETGFNFLASPSFVYGDQNGSNKISEKSEWGYFDLIDQKYGFIFEKNRFTSTNNVVIVPENFISLYGLRPGDLVQFKTRTISSQDNKYVAVIESVNNDSKYSQRKNFDDMQIEFLGGTAKSIFNGKNLKVSYLSKIIESTRNIVLVKSLKDYGNIINEMRKSINEDVFIINLCLDMLPEDVSCFSNTDNFESFYTFFGDSEKQNTITLNLACSRVKRLAELGKNVLIVVTEIKKAIQYQNFALNNSAEEIKNRSLDTCFALLSLAKRFKDNNISVCAFMKVLDNGESDFDRKLLNEFDNMNCNMVKTDLF